MGTLRGGGAGLIDVVEAAYAPASSEHEFVRAVAEAARPLMDHGHGCGAFTFDARDPLRFTCGSPVWLGPPEKDFAALSIRVNHEALSPAAARFLFYPGVPFGPVSRRLQAAGARPELENMSQLGSTLGVSDMLGSVSCDPSGQGLCLIAPLPETVTPSARLLRQWARVTTHVAAGFRLARAADAEPEAILDPDGRVLHAEEPATPASTREMLRHAARCVDRARGRLRRDDPAEALELWLGLVDGRWSLVDRFESDGRRYLVARRNDPQLPDPRALTLRERQVVGFVVLGQANKLVAYALGLTESAVSTHLSAAMRKLGVRSRADLVATLAALEGSDAAGSSNEPIGR